MNEPHFNPKTLKDLRIILDEPMFDYCNHDTVVCFWDLREEAIKRIEHLKTTYRTDKGFTAKLENAEIDRLIKWITHFFNLDLGEKELFNVN